MSSAQSSTRNTDLDAALDQETLEPSHASLDKRLQLGLHCCTQHPHAHHVARLTWFPGMTPPQNATSVQHWPRAAARFASRCATVVVGGIELRGMSTSVVTPPDAAARVPVQKPSQSVLPGSLRWTCALARIIAVSVSVGKYGEQDALDETWYDNAVARVDPVAIRHA